MRQIPLKLVLIVPFVLQIVGAVGLVGYLSYCSGQNAVEKLAHQVMNQASSRIRDRLDLVLQEQRKALAFNVQSIEQGTLNTNNPEAVRQHLWQQINSSSFLVHNIIGNEQGEEISYVRFFSSEVIKQAEKLTGETLQPGMIVLGTITLSNPNQLIYFLVDHQGRPRKTIYKMPVDPRKTPWYLATKNKTQASWSSIFTYRAIPSLGISIGRSMDDRARKRKVILVKAFTLADLGTFLKQLNFSPSGQAFILEPSGDLVATSTTELPFIRQQAQTPKRLPATQSQDPITKAIAVQLKQDYGNLAQIETKTALTVPLDNQKLLAQVEPYRDKYGLNWLLVTVIPESDFMGEIQENSQHILILCGIILLFVTAMGILTARWIIKPIGKLSLASEALIQGNWHGSSFDKSPIQELAVLVKSFERMSVKLETVFHESETRFTKIFRFSPYAMSIVNLNNSTYLAANDQFFVLTGYSKEEVIGHTVDELKLMLEREQALDIYHLLQTQQGTHNYEMALRTKSGVIKTILLSSELIQLEGQVFVLAVLNDISDRKKTEAALKESQYFNEQIANASPQILYVLDPITWTNFYVNHQIFEILGYIPEEFQQGGSQIFLDTLHPDDLPLLLENRSFWQTAQDGEILTTEYRMRHKNGSWHWLRSRDVVFARDENQQVIKVLGTAQDISDCKQQEEKIALQNSREILLKEITQKIRQTLDLNLVFNTAVEEIRNFLHCDRVAIFRFDFNAYTEGKVVAESVVLDIHSVISINIQEYCFHCFDQQYILQYQQGQVQIVNDIYETDFLECYIEFLEQLQVRSSINLPLLNNSKLWGLLSIHQFAQPRIWQDSEIDLLKQITDQLAIAIQQANLYQQTQQELVAKNELFLQLNNELNQKKILLKEIHHRVKNNLQIMSSLLYLQFRKASSEIQILSEDYQNRIQSMALIHEQLYRSEDLDKIDFNAYLLNLTTNIFQSYSINPDLIQLKLNVDKIVINLDQSVPLGLIVHELVSNAIKHAFPTGQGEIAITLTCSEQQNILTVTDNGMGISPDIDLQNTDSLGMQLIYSLTEQLQGQVRYTYQAGSHFEIIFPRF